MTREPIREAPVVETEHGRVPDGEGWFVVNVADTPASASEGAGHAHVFEAAGGDFPDFGINIHVLQPGEPNGLYHAEEGQEAFLVLQGECLLIVEDQERTLRQWDFFYAAPWTAHIIVGAGDGPCAVLMVGARNVGDGILYPVSEVAQRHRAGVARETDRAEEAYPSMGWKPTETVRAEWPPR
jgi:uncharacterized cupin superfamily protein